jgi:hypothetical protein
VAEGTIEQEAPPAEGDTQQPMSNAEIAAAVDAKAAEAPAGETPEGQPAESPQPEGGQPAPQADPRADINAFAEEVGVSPASLSRFDSVDAARAAVQFMVESVAQQGLSADMGQYQATPRQDAPAPQAAAPEGQPAQSVDLSALGLDESDPAAKVIKAMESKLSQTDAQTAAIQQKFAELEQSRQSATRQQLESQAEDVVSGFASEQYGTKDNRTAAQQLAVNQLYDLADAIAIGHHRSGRPIPSIQQRLAQARMIHQGGTTRPSSSAAPGQPATASPGGALPSQNPAPAGPAAPMKFGERWSQNPELRRQLGI